MQPIKTKESPFSPGKPVPIDYFVARYGEIKKLERSIQQVASGKNINVFITGERGIGKSSLASFVRYLAEKDYNFIGAHCFLGGVTNLERMVQVIFQRILQETSEKVLFDKLKDLFNKYIKGITLFGVGIEFTSDPSELRSLVDNFLPAIAKIYEESKETKKGIILILDDLNGITDMPELSNFLKSLIDEIATSRQTIPLLLILVGIQERMNDLVKHQPSVGRIFDVIGLSPMTSDESREFFEKTFKSQNITLDHTALSLLLDFSGGLPMLMHETGEAAFWVDQNNIIEREDATIGIGIAAENIGRKYLDPKVYQVIRSPIYRSILRKLGRRPLGISFLRKEIKDELTEKEGKNFDNFLRKAEQLGIITKVLEERGKYRFANQLFHLYVLIEAFRVEKESKR